jgi:betaine/carnitine transporter, BCCT family
VVGRKGEFPMSDEVETGYEAGQDNVQVMGLDIHNPVFFISSILTVGFVIVVLMFQG